MGRRAVYDEIADWYEHEFLAQQADGDPLGIRQALAALLGRGRGACLEIGCGTGVYAAQVRRRGWSPLGVDVSSGTPAAGCRWPARTPVACLSATARWAP
ncbi:hypothetical protein ABT297_28340 [Dactylosporangium sp. NPDC000555]|uniref:hypothetical protein n=1 Tax=Dactylosporangium sp. NPDC000555 TaxID=3154260 RepID=UPI0033167562